MVLLRDENCLSCLSVQNGHIIDVNDMREHLEACAKCINRCRNVNERLPEGVNKKWQYYIL